VSRHHAIAAAETVCVKMALRSDRWKVFINDPSVSGFQNTARKRSTSDVTPRQIVASRCYRRGRTENALFLTLFQRFAPVVNAVKHHCPAACAGHSTYQNKTTSQPKFPRLGHLKTAQQNRAIRRRVGHGMYWWRFWNACRVVSRQRRLDLKEACGWGIDQKARVQRVRGRLKSPPPLAAPCSRH
jgi:hypothetical protein